MGLSFRSVAPTDVLETNGNKKSRGRAPSNEFAQCELGGLGYVLTEGVDYVPDNSTDETAPKLSSVRQRLLNYAKTWTERRKKAGESTKDVILKTETKVYVDDSNGEVTKIPVLWFQFNEGERKARKPRTKATVITMDNVTTTTAKSTEAV